MQNSNSKSYDAKTGGGIVKWFVGILSTLVAASSLYSAQDFRSRYRQAESYEIRPGVLMMPKYGPDGGICQVAIEKLHVHADTVDLGSTIPHDVVLNLIDELSPRAERGKVLIQLGGLDYITNVSGTTRITSAEYENVSIHIYGTRSSPVSGDVAVILTWKKKGCA